MPTEARDDQVAEAVGRRIREARAERGWTLDELADRSGVSRRMIVNVEAGTSNASLDLTNLSSQRINNKAKPNKDNHKPNHCHSDKRSPRQLP